MNEIEKDALRRYYREEKVLAESRILEIGGEGEVEKAKILNLDEDEKYDLFVDRVIIPETMVVVTACEDAD